MGQIDLEWGLPTMYFRSTLVLAALLALCADTPDLAHFRMPMLAAPSLEPFPAATNNSEVFMSVAPQGKSSGGALQEGSRISIIRYVDGEFAKVLQPLPGGRKGFKLDAGKPLDEKSLKESLRVARRGGQSGRHGTDYEDRIPHERYRVSD